ncbi:hypothetical protein LOTGIDRAFT_172822 [Lottia gigantea]|uniref:VWFC domain-containing protein n=1 Tax=Lottia gigantea TaxID=225164 RepID=V4B535_LOTGI|nr:hypothetical protein LOTGIDRAFT_172822 [Lottia gigantea]ESP01087.1 hypothetical protein LOTGIDRAFT_172822 [Lottia gigantea]
MVLDLMLLVVGFDVTRYNSIILVVKLRCWMLDLMLLGIMMLDLMFLGIMMLDLMLLGIMMLDLMFLGIMMLDLMLLGIMMLDLMLLGIMVLDLMLLGIMVLDLMLLGIMVLDLMLLGIMVLDLMLLGVGFDVTRYNGINLMDYINISENDAQAHPTSNNHNKTLALVMDETVRQIVLPDNIAELALKLISNTSKISFLATVKQEIGNSGSIIALSAGMLRFLDIESRGGRDEIRFHYTHRTQIQVETFPYRLGDNTWHKLAVILNDNQLSLYIDCNKIYERTIEPVDRTFKAGKLSLFIGQRNRHHAFFRGYLKDIRIVGNDHGHLLQCKKENSGCPSIAQYEYLEDKLNSLYTEYNNMSTKLTNAEKHIKDLQNCNCLNTCYVNGTLYKEGDIWKKEKCSICNCKNSSVMCNRVECPDIKCLKPFSQKGQCCPSCLMSCFYSGQYYSHGENFQPRVCVKCICDNGETICLKQNPEEICPKLNCTSNDTIHVEGECCPICKGTDFCGEGNDCHVNAVCVNLLTKYACQCNEGYQGDGRHCGAC